MKPIKQTGRIKKAKQSCGVLTILLMGLLLMGVAGCREKGSTSNSGNGDSSYLTVSVNGGTAITYSGMAANTEIKGIHNTDSGHTNIFLSYIGFGEMVGISLIFVDAAPGEYLITPYSNTLGRGFYLDSSIDDEPYESAIGIKGSSGTITITDYDISANNIEGSFSIIAFSHWGKKSLSFAGSFRAAYFPENNGTNSPVAGAPKLSAQPTVSTNTINSGDAIELYFPTTTPYAEVFLIGLDDPNLNPIRTISKTGELFTAIFETSPATPSGEYYWQITLDPYMDLKTVYSQYWFGAGANFYASESNYATDEWYSYASGYAMPYITINCTGVDYYFYTFAADNGAVYTVYDASWNWLRNNSSWGQSYTGNQQISASRLCLTPGDYLIKVLEGGSGSYSILVTDSPPDLSSDYPHGTVADNDPTDDSSATPNILTLGTPATHTMGTGDTADWFKITIP